MLHENLKAAEIKWTYNLYGVFKKLCNTYRWHMFLLLKSSLHSQFMTEFKTDSIISYIKL